MVDHVNVSPHPWMDIALDRQHNLLAAERSFNRGGIGRLRSVPLAVDARERVDIVRGRIAVGNTEYLTALQRNNTWLVGATLLVKRHRSAGNLKLALEALFYPDEHSQPFRR